MSCTLSTRGQCRNSSRGLRPLAVAIHMSVTGLLAAGVLTAPLAQAQSAAATHAFNIPSGPLGATLSRIAADAGILLSFPPALVAGKEAPALRGTLTTDAALDRVLVGSGLVAVKTDTGITLQAAVGEEAMLAPVSVKDSGFATEGQRTYAARSTNTALGLTLSPRETPQSVSVITRARIEDQALNDISQVLDQTVGVTFNGTSALGSDGVSFYARGFEIKNFQIDGIPRPPAIYGFSETTTDLAIYDSVEIVRGSTGLMNGAGAPSATINLVRKHPTADTRAYVSAQIGSNDRYRLEADVGGPLTASGNVRGRVVVAYEESDSHLDRANLEKEVIYGILDVDLTDNTLLTVGAEYQDFTNKAAPRGGVPLFFADGREAHFSRSTNVATDWSDFNHQTTRLFASLEHRFDSGWWVKLDGEESRPDYDEKIGYLYAGGGLDAATGAGGTLYSARWAGDLKQRIINLTASGPFDLFGRGHEAMIGVNRSVAEDQAHDYPGWWLWDTDEYRQELPSAWNFLDTGNYPKTNLQALESRNGGRIEQNGAYAAVRLKPADVVSVIVGARVSDWKETDWTRANGVRSSTNTLAEESGVVTPYAGVVVDLNENFSVYASYTDIFEPQSNEDLSGHRLDPLEGANYELGVKAEFADGAFNASAAIFRIEQDNLAVALPGDLVNPNGNTAYRAESGTVSKGVELEVAGEALPGWQVGGGYARAKPEDSDGERLLTEIPKDTFKLFTTYKMSDLTVGGNLRWQGRIYKEDSGPNGETFTQDSLVLLDLMAKYALTSNFALALNLNNVFDKEYYSGLSWSTGVYGAPRNLMLSARYSY